MPNYRFIGFKILNLSQNWWINRSILNLLTLTQADKIVEHCVLTKFMTKIEKT